MKKLIFFAGLYCLQPTLHAGIINPAAKNEMRPISASDRALAHFKENYTEAEDVIWFSGADKSLFCYFRMGNTTNRVYYDKHGYWEYTMMSYPASHLSKSVKILALENFPGYEISYVNEIQSDKNDPVYIINLEDQDNIKVIKVTGEELEVKQELRKR